ncbi:MAG: rod-binding protein [Deltaproteobacteria bacterium]|nr:rod-binding protein [Deltaproteobacteria bacterium]
MNINNMMTPPAAGDKIVSSSKTGQKGKAGQAKDQVQGKLRSACQDFEAYMLYKMMETMEKNIPKGKSFHGGRGEEIFNSFKDQEMTNGMARAGGIGLADILMQQLSGPAAKNPTGGQKKVETGTKTMVTPDQVNKPEVRKGTQMDLLQADSSQNNK